MGDIADGYASPYGEKPVSACCRNYKEIKFYDCPKHLEIRFASPRCPVCVLEEERIRLYDAIASLQILQATATAE